MQQNPKLSQAHQQEIVRLQQLQQSLEVILQQKSTMEIQLRDTEYAIKELELAGEDATVYKSGGGIFIKSDQKTLIESSEENKELLVIKLKNLENQETRIRKQFEDQRTKVQEILKNQGLS